MKGLKIDRRRPPALVINRISRAAGLGADSDRRPQSKILLILKYNTNICTLSTGRRGAFYFALIAGLGRLKSSRSLFSAVSCSSPQDQHREAFPPGQSSRLNCCLASPFLDVPRRGSGQCTYLVPPQQEGSTSGAAD